MNVLLSSWILRLSIAITVLSAAMAAYGPLLAEYPTAAVLLNGTVAFLSTTVGILRAVRPNPPITERARNAIAAGKPSDDAGGV